MSRTTDQLIVETLERYVEMSERALYHHVRARLQFWRGLFFREETMFERLLGLEESGVVVSRLGWSAPAGGLHRKATRYYRLAGQPAGRAVVPAGKV